ncbi:hypothetical protein KOR42_47500 [Thalassoglobus neptunius]|uniref:Uncharacterized protein n=2 Tax=Thalassoglobus neptunius TaxID=1938619 RepID=A0A5C5VUP8_9PLAN|nr:hypothetical protein KOR42_47500 [Thalassoglobus neptunius]
MVEYRRQGRFLIRLLAFWITWQLASPIVRAQDSESVAGSRQSPMEVSAVIESAKYAARFHDADLVDGRFEWKIARLGDRPAAVDLTPSNLAMSPSSADSAAWGTTPSGEQIVLVNKPQSTIRGSWSRRGDEARDVIFITCQFPDALDSQLSLELPHGFELQSSSGIVSVDTRSDDFRIWSIDLGRTTKTVLTIRRRDFTEKQRPIVYTADSVYLARRAGLFVQTDLLISGIGVLPDQISLEVPRQFAVQSITVAGGTLSFQRVPERPHLIEVDLPKSVSNDRIALRVQGLYPLWIGQMRSLPLIRTLAGRETSHKISLRVDPPLELQQLRLDGFVQTDLVSEEGTEVWKFQSFAQDKSIRSVIAMPRQSVRLSVHQLIQSDVPLPWCLIMLSLSAESGAAFESTLNLPEGLEILSVGANQPSARVASWNVVGNLLQIDFQTPLSTTTPRKVAIFARCPGLKPNTEHTLPLLTNADGLTVESKIDWVIPGSLDVEVSEPANWNRSTTEYVPVPETLNLDIDSLPEIGQRLLTLTRRNVSMDDAPKFLVRSKSEEMFPSEESPQLTDISPVEPFEESFSDAASVQGELRVVSELVETNDSQQVQLVQHTLLRFDRPISIDQLNLTLPSNCRISAASIDRKALTVFRDGNKVLFPSEVQQVTEVDLVYLIESETISLTQQFRVPLPETAVPLNGLEWKLITPDNYEFVQAKLPGFSSKVNSQHFFFGPLTDPWMRTLTNSLGARLLRTQKPLSTPGRTRVPTDELTFRSLRTGAEVTFVAWNLGMTWNLAWTGFFLSLLIGVGGRMQSIVQVKHAAPYWIAALMVALLLIDNALSMILGAMLIGSVISSLIPLQFRPANSTSPRRTQSSSRLSKAKMATVVFVMTLLISREAFAQLQPITDAVSDDIAPILNSVDVQKSSDYLIKSSHYELVQTFPNYFVNARLTVLVPDRQSETFVWLPFENVIFPRGAQCHVDGQPEPLIPHLSGRGVVVRFEQSTPPAATAQLESWTEHEIQLEWMVQSSSDDPPHAGIPKVLDTRLTIPGRSGLDAIERDGRVFEIEDESTSLDLGGVDQLTFEGERRTSLPSDSDLRAATMLTVSPQDFDGQTVLSRFEAVPDRFLYLEIPEEATIERTTGRILKNAFLSHDIHGRTSLALELNQDRTSEDTVQIDFSISSPHSGNEQLLIVPEIDWGEKVGEHFIGVRPPTGFEIQLSDSSTGIEFARTTEFSKLNKFAGAPPSIVVLQQQNAKISVDFFAKQSQTVAEFRDVLTVRSDSAEWESFAELTTSGLPSFRQEFDITGGVIISSVVDVNPSGDSPLRFHQAGSRLTVFLSKGQLGKRSLQLHGTIPLEAAKWAPVPQARLTTGANQSRDLTVVDYTNWNFEIRNTSQQLLLEAPIPDFDPSHPRIIAVDIPESDESPLRFQVTPPVGQLSAECAVRMKYSGRSLIGLTHIFRVQTETAATSQIVLTIPKSLGSFRIPSGQRRESVIDTGDETELSLLFNANRLNDAVITVETQFAEPISFPRQNQSNEVESLQIPMIRVNEQLPVKAILVIPQRRQQGMTIRSGIVVSPKQYPSWLPNNWWSATGPAAVVAYELLSSEIVLDPIRTNPTNENVSPSYAETVIWPQGTKDRILANSSFWLHVDHLKSLKWHLAEGTEIDSVTARGGTILETEQSVNEFRATIESDEPIVIVNVRWSGKMNSDGTFTLLKAESSKPFTHLVGVVETESATLDTGSIDRSSRISKLMLRWDALVELIPESPTTISIDHVLIRNLNETRQVVFDLSDSGALSETDEEMTVRIREEWDRIQDRLIVTSDLNEEGQGATNEEWGIEVASPTESNNSIDWFPASENPTFRLKRIDWWSRSGVTFATIWLFLAAGIFLLGLKSSIVAKSGRFLDHNPEIALAALGFVWALLLSPPIFSLLFVLPAAALGIRRLIRNSSRAREASTS